MKKLALCIASILLALSPASLDRATPKDDAQHGGGSSANRIDWD